MLAKTFRNRCLLFIANATVVYLFYSLTLLGLLPFVKPKDKKLGLATSPAMTFYCLFCGCLMTSLYTWIIVSLLSEAQEFYSGAGNITFTILYLSSAFLIITFYVIAFLNRFKMRDYYNITIERYGKFTSFYATQLTTDLLSYEHIDGDAEFNFVYKKMFIKAVLVHNLVIYCVAEMSKRGHSIGHMNRYQFLGFFLLPHLVKSLTSSFLYMSGARLSYMYLKLDNKLRELRDELGDLTVATMKSRYEKMSRFCEISDLVDNLCKCYDYINETAVELIDLYSVQMWLVLTFSVINTLHGLFSQYQVVADAITNGKVLDTHFLIFNCLFVTFNLAEIMMVVNITDICHRGSAKIGKTIQSLIYFGDLDIRLRQSVSET